MTFFLFLFDIRFVIVIIDNMKFTAIYKKSGKWYMGWIEEISGVNTQGRTLKEAKENLKEALSLIIETNRLINRKETTNQKVIREPLTVSI